MNKFLEIPKIFENMCVACERYFWVENRAIYCPYCVSENIVTNDVINLMANSRKDEGFIY